MYSTLLFVAALFSSNVVLANVLEVQANEKFDDLTVDSERQERQFWPSDVPNLDSFYQDPSIPEGESEPQTRQNLWGLSNINSAINPIAALMNQRPGAYIKNPNTPSILRRYDSCDDPNGLKGVCVPASFCSKYGGRPSGSCSLGLACCINAVSKCGGLVTLNNTYWQSPPAISSDSTCGLTVALDNNLVEQKRPVCQIRLDFLSFTIAQPEASSVCVLDTFTVGGAINKVPTICGENTGQHMYLNVPASTVDVVLLFTFGKSPIIRSWNVQISLLPCGSFYLAPADCLQYFRENTGTIKSFNWRDVVPVGTRHLANQDYQICFRNQQIASQANARICFTPCVVTAVNGGNPFLLSGLAGGVSQKDIGGCPQDFLMIRDGFDSAIPANIADRYCGGAFNPATPGVATSVTVCTTVRDYQVYFKTDVAEAAVGETNNSGFCLDFTQSTTN